MKLIKLRALFLVFCLAMATQQASAGILLRVFYDGDTSITFEALPGTSVDDLRAADFFPAGPNPDGYALFTDLWTDGMIAPRDVDMGLDYGSYIRGYIQAPMEGDYVFYIASDDASELWLSSDTDPANIALVAAETACCTALFGGDRLAERSTDVVNLSRGQWIYFEILHKEGDGGDWVEVGWERPDGVQEIIPSLYVAPLPLDPTNFSTENARQNVAPVILAEYGQQLAPVADGNPGAPYPVPNAGQPLTQTVVEQSPVSFTVAAEHSFPVTYQWLRNGTEITDATLASYHIPKASLADNGATFSVRITNAHGDVTSDPATLTVTPDAIAPTVLSAATRGNPNGIVVAYSEPMDEASALSTANYSLSGGVSVTGAVFGDTEQEVILTTGDLDPATQYTLQISAVSDQAETPNVISPNPTSVAVSTSQGVITRDFFNFNVGLDGLLADSRYPDEYDSREFRTLFEGPVNAGANYSTHFQGYLHAPETGDYVFYVSSDDQSRLWLSVDEDPANRVQIANEPQWHGSREYLNTSDRRPNQENISEPQTLEAGQRYWIEVIHQEGGGGDNISVAWKKPSDPVPTANDQLAPIPGEFLSSHIPSGPIVITQQPQDASLAELQQATFSVEVTGTPAYEYQWMRDGTPIIGAIGPDHTFTTSVDDDGAEFSVEISNWFSSETSDTATLTVDTDTVPPAVDVVEIRDATFSTVTVVFSEPVTQASAENTANYSIQPTGGGAALTVNSAVLGADTMSVTLNTATQPMDTEYEITIENVADRSVAGNVMTETTRTFSTWGELFGGATRMFYNYTGNFLTDVYTPDRDRAANTFPADPAPEPFLNTPTSSGFRPLFESGRDVADNYGVIMHAWVIPPVDGAYTFYISADDGAQLWLSTDDDPANAVQIASEPTWNGNRTFITGTPDDAGDTRRNTAAPENISAEISLLAGQRYWLEAAVNEGGGGDGVEVAWQIPDGPVIQNGSLGISGDYLVTIGPLAVDLDWTVEPQDQTVAANTPVTFSSLAVGSGPLSNVPTYQWQTSADGGAFTDIPGATGADYTIPFVSVDQDGDQFRSVATLGGTSINSQAATLTVGADVTAPAVLSGYTTSPTEIIVSFDEPVDTTTGETVGNYALDGGGMVTAASVSGNVVTLTASGLTEGTTYTLTVTGVEDRSGNVMDPSPTTLSITAQTYVAGGSNAALDPADPRVVSTHLRMDIGSLTERGFFGEIHQNPAFQEHSRQRVEDQLNGLLGQNLLITGEESNLGAEFTHTGVINFNNNTDQQGRFSTAAEPPADPAQWEMLADQQFPLMTATDQDGIGMQLVAYLELEPGIYRMGVTSDDGFGMYSGAGINDPDRTVLSEVFVGRGAADSQAGSVFDFVVPEAGLYPFTLIWEEGNGGANLEWWTKEVDNPVRNDPPGNLVNSTSGVAAYVGPVVARPVGLEIESITLVGGSVEISWPEGTLQSAPTVNGPWSNVDGASSPYTTPADQEQMYFRLVQ